jgi:TRAP transporter 4TM/12TM fusion protein
LSEPGAAPGAGGAGVRAVSGALAGAIAVLAVIWAGDFHRPLGLGFLLTEQMAALALGFASAFVFLNYPFRRPAAETPAAPRRRVPALDTAAATLAVVVGAVIAVRYPVLNERAFYHPVEALAVSAVAFVLVIEALRRAVGWSLIWTLAAFAGLALVAHLLPGKLQGKRTEAADLLIYAVLDGSAMLGASLLVAVEVVLPFVLFGALLQRAGGSAFFADASALALGRYRGGAAKVAILGSCLFGLVSGSAVANVAAVGIVTIPLMIRAGYPRVMAGAIEATGSTGGQIMPPVMGAAAFLMAENLQRPYGEIAVAAILPALLFYATLFVYADLEAARRGIRGLAREEVPRARAVFAAGWHFPVAFAALIGALFLGHLRTEKAALIAVGVVLVLGLLRGYAGKRLAPRDVLGALADTGRGGVEIVVICAVAGMIVGVLAKSSLDFSLTFILVEFGRESLMLLLAATALVALVLGLGLPTTGVYLLLAALAAPPLVKLGVDALAAHMFVFYFGMLSMVTPPVAIAAFTAANIARAGPMETGWAATRFAWPSYVVPFLFVLSPTLLLQGAPGAVILDAATAVLGIGAVTAGFVGHLRRPMGAAERAAFILAGAALLAPAAAFAGAGWAKAAGALVGAAALAWHLVRGGTARPT